ncbi:MAG: hypothetical protein OHK0039_15180 [Bacteroidia bacterium]
MQRFNLLLILACLLSGSVLSAKEAALAKDLPSGWMLEIAGATWNLVAADTEAPVYAIGEMGEYIPVSIRQAMTQYDQWVYESVYPFIDLMVQRGENDQLVYAFVVYPGGNPNDIVLQSQQYTSLASLPVQAGQQLNGTDTSLVSLTWTIGDDGLRLQAGAYEQAQVLTIQMP